MIKRFLQTPDDQALTFLRLALGIVFFAHGAQKALGWFGGYGFAGTVQGLSSMGLPAPVAVLVILTEFLGSIALILGLLTRLASLGIGALMLGAIVMVHAKNGFFMNWFGQQKGEGFEYHILVLGMAVALLIRGAGAFSVDRLWAGNGEASPVLQRHAQSRT